MIDAIITTPEEVTLSLARVESRVFTGTEPQVEMHLPNTMDLGMVEQEARSRLVIRRFDTTELRGSYETPSRWTLGFRVRAFKTGKHEVSVEWQGGAIYRQITAPDGEIIVFEALEVDVLEVAESGGTSPALAEFVERRDHGAVSYLRVLDLFEAINGLAPGPFARFALSGMDLLLKTAGARPPTDQPSQEPAIK